MRPFEFWEQVERPAAKDFASVKLNAARKLKANGTPLDACDHFCGSSNVRTSSRCT
jgi:hypothetical protein